MKKNIIFILVERIVSNLKSRRKGVKGVRHRGFLSVFEGNELTINHPCINASKEDST